MPSLATDCAALLDGVLADPDDDGVRLVYADYLEEHGEPARAEFIRVQLALARRWECPNCQPGDYCFEGCPDCDLASDLRRRERELLSGDFCRWGVRVPGFTSHYRRGFVESVTCTLADWLAHGPAVVRCQPVTRVDVTDRKPTYNSRVYLGRPAWGWWDKSQYTSRARGQSSDAEDLPENVWRQLPGRIRDDTAWAWYEFEADARAALSTALLMMVGSSSMKVTTPLSLTPR